MIVYAFFRFGWWANGNWQWSRLPPVPTFAEPAIATLQFGTDEIYRFDWIMVSWQLPSSVPRIELIIEIWWLHVFSEDQVATTYPIRQRAETGRLCSWNWTMLFYYNTNINMRYLNDRNFTFEWFHSSFKWEVDRMCPKWTYWHAKPCAVSIEL